MVRQRNFDRGEKKKDSPIPRGLFYKGSSPLQELEIAKTALALGQDVDVGALMGALEWMLEHESEELREAKQEAEDYKAECEDKDETIDKLETEIREMQGED